MSLFGILLAVVAVATQACSSDDNRQDRFYGSDAAADFGGPEVGFIADSSTQSDKDADAGDDGPMQNSDADAKDTNGSADASADLGASDTAPAQ